MMLESLANLGLTLIEAKQRFAHVQRDVVAAGPQPRLGSALLPSGAHRSTDGRDRVTAKAAIVPQIERLRWRIWHGKEECPAQHYADPHEHAFLRRRA
jgi:hypothetical protein